MLQATLSASIGCFTGLVFALLTRTGSIVDTAIDAVFGIVGALGMAWFIRPISDSAQDFDNLNVAAVIGAVFGALMLVAVVKAVRGR